MMIVKDTKTYIRNMPEINQDFENIKRFIAGDESSFNKIANKYKEKIYWHARRMTGNHLDADDIVQEVLVVIYNKLKDFRFKSSLYTWIYKITSTRSINYIKKRDLKKFFSLDNNDIINIKNNNDIINDMDVKEKLNRIDKYLQKIPLRQREVFILRNFDELSYEEIANITGKSIGGLKANYFHAFKKISEMVEKDGL